MNKTLRNFGITSLIMAFGAAAGVSANAGGPGRYYVGAGAGTSMGQHLMRSTFTLVGTPNVTYPDNRKYSKKSSFLASIFGGYLHEISVFSIGAELGVDVGSETSKLSTSMNVTGNNLNYEFQLNRQYTLRAITKFGLNLSDQLSVYALMGAANSRFKLSYVNHIGYGDWNSSQSKNLWAFVPGGEVVYHIDSNWSAGVIYTCDIYQTFKSGQFTQSTGATPYDFFQTKISPVFHNIMARVTYRF